MTEVVFSPSNILSACKSCRACKTQRGRDIIRAFNDMSREKITHRQHPWHHRYSILYQYRFLASNWWYPIGWNIRWDIFQSTLGQQHQIHVAYNHNLMILQDLKNPFATVYHTVKLFQPVNCENYSRELKGVSV